MSVQPSSTRSSASNTPDTRLLKFSIRRRCQPGSRLGCPLRIGRPVAAHVDRRRRALEDVQLLGRGAEVRHALHRGRAGADDADALVGQAGEVPVGVAAGVVVVPAAGVERVARGTPRCRGSPGSFGRCSGPLAMHDEAGAHGVAAVGRHDPARVVVVPRSPSTSVWKQASSVEAVVLADRPAVGEDLRRPDVLLRRHVAELLEQRQVDVRLDVAHRARVAVPVPGAAEVAALLDRCGCRRCRPRAGARRRAGRRSRRR